MKTLGILCGMSPESSATYYTQINRLVNQQLGGNHSARLVMLSVDFEEIVQCQKSGQWQKSGEILADAALKLEQIGAQGILLATNTMHKVAQQIQQAVLVPFLHVLDVTAEAIKASGLQRVALLGTWFTMHDDFYRGGLSERGIEAIVPNDATQQAIHRIIFEELCVGKFTPQAKAFYLDTINTLRQQGAQGVILGCTEIGLLIRQADAADLPFFDTAELHAQMAADFILERKA